MLLAGSALLGTVLHLSMDALNSYGVHPFWPVQNRWLYGDSVFIVEPLYWVASTPLLLVSRSAVARILIGLVLLAAVGLSSYSGIVPQTLCAGMALLIAILFFFASRVSPRVAASLGIAMTIGITAMFITAGAIAAQRVESLAHSRFPSEQMLDHILTPMPANPVCWDLLLLQRQGDDYRARHAIVSLAPSLLNAHECPVRANEKQTASVTPPDASNDAAVRWLGEYQTSAALLKRTAGSSCIAARAMQFLRAPFLARLDGAEVIGDLRFDREPQLGFAELEIEGVPSRCPKAAPWTPPRQDLLR